MEIRTPALKYNLREPPAMDDVLSMAMRQKLYTERGCEGLAFLFHARQSLTYTSNRQTLECLCHPIVRHTATLDDSGFQAFAGCYTECFRMW